MGVKGTRGCKVQQRKDRAGAFTDKKKQAFLTSFAGSCNVAQAATEAGVATSTLYAQRMRDPAFRDAWAAAQDNAVASLRAELVRRGLELLGAATPGEASLSALQGMDAKFLLGLAEAHERNAGKQPGDIKPQRSDASEAAQRLLLLLKRMRAEREQEENKSNRQDR